MHSEFKIPTILGLAVLLIGLTAGVLLVSTNQVFKSKASTSSMPEKISVTNISDTHVSILWQTKDASSGFIQTGPTKSLGLTFTDERDKTTPQKYFLHFVTLTNLSPNTTYYYKINSGLTTYPADEPLTFTTAAKTTPSTLQPLIGTVLNQGSKPINEAFVTLNIPNAQPLSAIIKTNGNFVLPLTEILTADLQNNFNIPEDGINAELNIYDNNKTSNITLTLPFDKTTLPPITLGENLNLIVQKPTPTPTPEPRKAYDINDDGKVNTLDRNIIIQNFGKNFKNKKTDLNSDGVVDTKDISLINAFISENSLKK